jgi:hypothetical protein
LDGLRVYELRPLPDMVFNYGAAILHHSQQFPEACKSQHSSGIPSCLFVNRHAKMGLF